MKLLGLTLAALGSFSVAMAADVSVTLTVAPAAGLGPGNNLTYTAIVKNAGPGPAGAVSLAVTLPAVNIPISVTPHPQCAFNPAGTAVNCSLGTLAMGASAIVKIVVHPVTIGVKTSSAHVTAVGPDPNPANNNGSVSSTLTEVGISDMQVTLSDAPDPAFAGRPLVYTAVVRNNGDDDAANVVLSVVLPAGVTFGSAVSDRGARGPCVHATGTVICRFLDPFHTALPGSTSTVTIRVTPAPPGGFLYATAGVAMSTPDPNIANNCASVRTWVNP